MMMFVVATDGKGKEQGHHNEKCMMVGDKDEKEGVVIL